MAESSGVTEVVEKVSLDSLWSHGIWYVWVNLNIMSNSKCRIHENGLLLLFFFFYLNSFSPHLRSKVRRIEAWVSYLSRLFKVDNNQCHDYDISRGQLNFSITVVSMWSSTHTLCLRSYSFLLKMTTKFLGIHAPCHTCKSSLPRAPMHFHIITDFLW